MVDVPTSRKGIPYLPVILKDKPKVLTKAVLYKIPHDSPKEDVSLKIGRYSKAGFEKPEEANPRSELTLDFEELQNLVAFLGSNFSALKDGVRRYIPLDEKFDPDNIKHLKALFENPDKQKVLELILHNDIIPEELLRQLHYRERLRAVQTYEEMLTKDLVEHDWQLWFGENDWVLGSEFVRVLDDRSIDTKHISDFLMEAYDGFVDIVEIKRPQSGVRFWADAKDHGHYYPSIDLVKATNQVIRYLYELELEMNSKKFLSRVEAPIVKPRGVLIFGRSSNWDEEQQGAYRILNSTWHNVSVLTYDHVLTRAKRMLGLQDR